VCDGMGLGLRAKKEINGQQEVIAFIARNPVSLGRSPNPRELAPLVRFVSRPPLICSDINRSSSKWPPRTFCLSTRP
jgi:hypothetical protein